MLNDEVNATILKEKTAQARLVERVVQLAREYGFSGVVLDLEMSLLPLDSVRDEITSFITFFGNEMRANNLQSAVTIYGDVFYRARPYNMASIGQSVDEVMIMAYDFHKSRGEPGPNFPLNRGVDYGYDFKTMITDFTSMIPSENITVLFGMYGYDWTLGNQGLPLQRAKAVPLREIEEGYRNCRQNVIPDTADNPSGVIRNPERKTDKCMALMNDVSKEKSIQYVDEEGFTHELWYEDFESVEVKKEFMKTQGIGSVGYWVWGYW